MPNYRPGSESIQVNLRIPS